MESWVNLGIPDCILAVKGGFALAELKVATSTGRVKLSPHQVAFHEAHREHPCFVFAENGEGRKKTVGVYLSRDVRALAICQGEPAAVFPLTDEGLADLEVWIEGRVSTGF